LLVATWFEDLVNSLRDQRLARRRVKPDRKRRSVDPAKLDVVRRLSLHRQQTCMKRGVVT
jgi:hypothetical protein